LADARERCVVVRWHRLEIGSQALQQASERGRVEALRLVGLLPRLRSVMLKRSLGLWMRLSQSAFIRLWRCSSASSRTRSSAITSARVSASASASSRAALQSERRTKYK
jgi:hypothetical protein